MSERFASLQQVCQLARLAQCLFPGLEEETLSTKTLQVKDRIVFVDQHDDDTSIKWPGTVVGIRHGKGRRKENRGPTRYVVQFDNWPAADLHEYTINQLSRVVA